MARTIRTLHRSWIPGAGIDNTGNPVQGKTRVVAEVTISENSGEAYVLGGESLTARDLGLSNIDTLSCIVSNPGLNGNAVSSIDSTIAVYSFTDETLELGLVTGATGVRTDSVAEDKSADPPVVRIDALGDSALAPELLP